MTKFAKAYNLLLLSKDSQFSPKWLAKSLNQVKVLDILKQIVAAERAQLIVEADDDLPFWHGLKWEQLQQQGFISLEPLPQNPQVSSV